jgi:hypothetical protein
MGTQPQPRGTRRVVFPEPVLWPSAAGWSAAGWSASWARGPRPQRRVHELSSETQTQILYQENSQSRFFVVFFFFLRSGWGAAGMGVLTTTNFTRVDLKTNQTCQFSA